MKLSIVIPTRERHDTLRHTLRTMVIQDYVDCEFIVSDNFSQDDTRRVVESFSDDRIVYINTGSRVSMAENWEFALNHARGDYITYIGDDDGFIPGALTAAMSILNESGHDALVWEKADYCWPDYIEPSMGNLLSLRVDGFGKLIMSGNDERRRVLDFRSGYTKLPCLYNGIVNRRLVTDLQKKSINGLFFNAISPDAFSALAISVAVGEYLFFHYPFSVSGASRHSNGTSFMRRGTDGKEDNPTTKFYSENRLTYDSRIVLAPSIPVVVMGEYLLIQKYLSEFKLPEPSWQRYLKSLLKDAIDSNRPMEVLRSARHTAEQLGVNITLPEAGNPRQVSESPRTELDRGVLRFRPHRELVQNIYDACLLASSMVPSALSIRSDTRATSSHSWLKKIFR